MPLPALGAFDGLSELNGLLEWLSLLELDGIGDLVGWIGALIVGAGTTLLVIVAALVALVVGALGIRRLRRRRETRRRAVADRTANDAALRDLELRAGSALVGLDDAVRSAEEELGFAIAEYGDAYAGPFRAAIARARSRLTEAFGIRQRLDDAEPETPSERRELAARIVDLCRSGDETLREQRVALGRLRAADLRAVDQLDAATESVDAVAGRIAAAETLLTALRAEHGETAVDAVGENPADARRLVAFASERLEVARRARDTGSGGAADALEESRRAVGQADRLLEAVSALQVDLRDVGARLEGAMAVARTDVTAARSVEPSPAISTALARTEAALADVPALDRVTALASLERADADLDAALAGVRSDDDRRTRAITSLDRVLGEARAAVAGAREYIATRRGGIGPEARTRLSRAEGRLTDALGLAGTDPVEALANAQESLRYADEALVTARDDVRRFRSDAGSGLPRRPDGLEELGGALLGTVLDAVFADSRRGRRS